MSNERFCGAAPSKRECQKCWDGRNIGAAGDPQKDLQPGVRNVGEVLVIFFLIRHLSEKNYT